MNQSLAKAPKLLPLWVMLGLLLGSDLALQSGRVREVVGDATDGLWLRAVIAERGEDFLPRQQWVREEAVNEAYLRGVSKYGRKTKVLLVGDSTVYWVPGLPPFSRRLRRVLEDAYSSKDVGVYSLASQGQNHVTGFYSIKAALARFKPDLIVYVANTIHFTPERSDAAPRKMGFLDDDFMGPEEERAWLRLCRESRPRREREEKNFRRAQILARVQYISGLRRVLLPPAELTAAGDRCYFADCAVVGDLYWRDLIADPQQIEPIMETIEMMDSYDLTDESLNFTYLMLIPELARVRGVKVIMVIPPKNREMLEHFGRWRQADEAGAKLEQILAAAGVTVINCQDAVDEHDFQDTQHLRTQGQDAWIQCLREPLLNAAAPRP